MSEDRGAPDTTGRRLLTQRQTYAVSVLGAAALIAFVFWRHPGNEPPEPPAPAGGIGRRVTFDPPQPPPTTPPAEPGALAPPPPPAPPQLAAATMPQAAGAPRPPRMMSYVVTPPPRADDRAGAEGGGPRPAAGVGEGDAARRGTAVAFRGTAIAGARAGAPLDTTLVLMPGVYRCTLDTAVSSERPGPFFCHVTQDWLSPAGVRLMEAGTRIQGSYESHVAPGQSRILSLAATGWTPGGVPVPLGAPVGDALGRVGMDGAVDRHFWERFGGAVFLMLSGSAISAAQGALQAALARGSNNTYLNLQTGGVQGAVASVLRDSLAIPNTVTKNQGEEIALLLTGPVDFSDAYRLRLR
ncbi:TrbI/VirB10 family protein [Roseicella aquatilis]|uniref:TrbI/VirB10 family protein n=1 Tax=Roseicella aquatilis TaxID=2527868 RepID=A0A4V2WJK0_9PROT|nr:TrbI/VirB10 family protein [Roseicella aquatilis]TCZ54613.1 TrbI/VirB10 family protein [Roseicella aquatilis]